MSGQKIHRSVERLLSLIDGIKFGPFLFGTYDCFHAWALIKDGKLVARGRMPNFICKLLDWSYKKKMMERGLKV